MRSASRSAMKTFQATFTSMRWAVRVRGPGAPLMLLSSCLTADLNASSTTFLKLGRSIRPVARLSQWRSQCPTRQPVVRDIFPLHPSHPLRLDATSASLKQHALISPSRMHGALSFASQGAPNHRRWERLCLIELAGVAALQAAQRGTVESAREQCKDCGKIHIEMFLVDKSAYEQEVRDLVLRWQRFVETTASQ